MTELTIQIDSAIAALLQARRERVSLAKLAQLTRYSRTTLSLLINRRYDGNAATVSARVLSTVVPILKRKPPKPRKPLPPQLKELDPVVHARLKKLASHLAAKSCAELFGIDQARIWPLIRGTDKLGGADVVAKLSTVPFSEVQSNEAA